MQPVREAATVHDTTGESVDNEHRVVLYEVVDVALHRSVRLERLIYMVGELRIFGRGEVFDVEEFLNLADTRCGEHGGARLLVNDVIRVDIVAEFLLIHLLDAELAQAADACIRAVVHIGGFVALTRNDKRGARLVYQDGVDLVDDGENMSALNHSALLNDHVIAQIVKAELVVRSVCDVACVHALLFFLGLIVRDKTCCHAEKAVYTTHLLRAGIGEVFVDRNDVHALARQCVEVRGQGGDEGLTLTGFHLGDASLMQDDTAYQLNVERALAEHAVGCLGDYRERVGQNVVERFARGKALAQRGGGRTQLLVAHRAVLVGKGFYLFDDRSDLAYLTVAVGPYDRVDYLHIRLILTAVNFQCFFYFIGRDADNSGMIQ